MAEHGENPEAQSESLMEKIADKIHGDDSLSSSDSDNEKKPEKKSPEKKSPVSPPSSRPAPSTKSKIYRLFGREKPVHNVFGGGKRNLSLSIYICEFFLF